MHSSKLRQIIEKENTLTQKINIHRISAILYTIISAGVILFQIVLAAGAPWGEYAMGGAFPGQFPPALRIAALVQAALLAGMAAIVLARVDVMLCCPPGHVRQGLRRLRSALLPARGQLLLPKCSPVKRGCQPSQLRSRRATRLL